MLGPSDSSPSVVYSSEEQVQVYGPEPESMDDLMASERMMPVRVLKRGANGRTDETTNEQNRGSVEASNNVSKPTGAEASLSEREKQYEEAKKRIFGDTPLSPLLSTERIASTSEPKKKAVYRSEVDEDIEYDRSQAPVQPALIDPSGFFPFYPLPLPQQGDPGLLALEAAMRGKGKGMGAVPVDPFFASLAAQGMMPGYGPRDWAMFNGFPPQLAPQFMPLQGKGKGKGGGEGKAGISDGRSDASHSMGIPQHAPQPNGQQFYPHPQYPPQLQELEGRDGRTFHPPQQARQDCSQPHPLPLGTPKFPLRPVYSGGGGEGGWHLPLSNPGQVYPGPLQMHHLLPGEGGGGGAALPQGAGSQHHPQPQGGGAQRRKAGQHHRGAHKGYPLRYEEGGGAPNQTTGAQGGAYRAPLLNPELSTLMQGFCAVPQEQQQTVPPHLASRSTKHGLQFHPPPSMSPSDPSAHMQMRPAGNPVRSSPTPSDGADMNRHRNHPRGGHRGERGGPPPHFQGHPEREHYGGVSPAYIEPIPLPAGHTAPQGERRPAGYKAREEHRR